MSLERSNGGRAAIRFVACCVAAACAAPAGHGALDAGVVAELGEIADILARPHEFPASPGSGRGTSGTSHPIDYGCVQPDDFLPDGQWVREGLALGTSDVVAFDPDDASRRPTAAVPRACWRLEKLGCAAVLRASLEAIMADDTLGSAARCQAVRAIGSIGDVAAAARLVGVVGEDIVGPEAVRSLHRMGRNALAGIRQAGLPAAAMARSRITWLLGRHAEDLTVAEIDWLVRGLAGPQYREAIWALVRVNERQPAEVVAAARALLARPEPAASVWALLACARVRDAAVEAAAASVARLGAAEVRQLALQYLGRIESPEAADTLLGLLRDATAPVGDRAAAVLGLSFHRAARSRSFDDLAGLLGSDDARLVRAALQLLWNVPDVPDALLARAKALTSSSDRDIRFLAMSVGTPR